MEEKMKKILFAFILFLFATVQINAGESRKNVRFPEKFVGKWIFDVAAAENAINRMNIPEGDKLKLKSSYIDMARGQQRSISGNGVMRVIGMPDHVTIEFTVVEKRDNGFVLAARNSLNPSEKQFTLNTMSNGVWRVTMLNNALNPVKGTPDDFWKRVSD